MEYKIMIIVGILMRSMIFILSHWMWLQFFLSQQMDSARLYGSVHTMQLWQHQLLSSPLQAKINHNNNQKKIHSANEPWEAISMYIISSNSQMFISLFLHLCTLQTLVPMYYTLTSFTLMSCALVLISWSSNKFEYWM